MLGKDLALKSDIPNVNNFVTNEIFLELSKVVNGITSQVEVANAQDCIEAIKLGNSVSLTVDSRIPDKQFEIMLAGTDGTLTKFTSFDSFSVYLKNIFTGNYSATRYNCIGLVTASYRGNTMKGVVSVIIGDNGGFIFRGTLYYNN